MKLKITLSAFVILLLMSLGCQKTTDIIDTTTDSGFVGNWKGQVIRVEPMNSTTSTDVFLTFSSPDLLVYRENNEIQNYFWESNDDIKILTLLLHQAIGSGQVSVPLVTFPKQTYSFSENNNHLEFWYKTQGFDIKYILDRQ